MEDITVVSDLAWIPRGVAKLEPIKLQMDKAQLSELLQGDNAGTDEEQSAMEEEKVEKTDESADEPEKEGNMMKGVAVYADPKDDPYLTKHEDSEDEAEKDDFLLRSNDNLLAVAKMLHDEPTLDVYVFNKENDDWYIHHSYYLSSPPLCIAPIQYDPGSETGKGNLLALGSFEPTIDIWDLDIYNALEPIVVLGKQTSSNRKKRDNSAQGHSDAVTCLDWNKQCEHILASGSADQTVVLWDLDERKPSTIINLFDDKLASIQWHPVEEALLLTGTKSGKAQIIDCRNVTPTSSVTWELKAEIERAIWNVHNPFCFFVATDDGNLHYLDSRQPGSPVASILAHEDGCNSVAQNPQIHGMIATVGENELKIWKLTNEGPEFKHVHTYEVKMGKLFTVAFNPDVHNTLAVGGASEELTRLFDLEECTEVRSAFESVFEDVAMVED